MQPAEIEKAIEALRNALDRNALDEAITLIEGLRAPDQAEVFNELELEERATLLPRLDPDMDTDVVGFGLFLGLATIFVQWLV